MHFTLNLHGVTVYIYNNQSAVSPNKSVSSMYSTCIYLRSVFRDIFFSFSCSRVLKSYIGTRRRGPPQMPEKVLHLILTTHCSWTRTLMYEEVILTKNLSRFASFLSFLSQPTCSLLSAADTAVYTTTR